MSFLHPLYLWGLAALSIPILIHLYGRRRPRRVFFPSLRLLRQTQQQRRSLARLRNIIILILRMLAILAVVAALAGPVSESRLLGALAPGRLTALILLDTSASMQYREDVSSFDRARDAALQILHRLPRGSRALIASATNRVTLAAGNAEQAIRDLKPSLAPSVPPAVLCEAAATLSRIDSEHGRIFLVTDNHASAWRGELSADDLPTHPPLWVVDVSAPSPRNLGLIAAGPADTAPIPGRPLRYEATISQCGAPPDTDTTVTISPADKPAFARTIRPFIGTTRLAFATDSPSGGVLDLPPDGLSADNRFYYPGYGRVRLRTIILPGSNADRRYLRAALASIGGLTQASDLTGADLALLANAADPSSADLTAYTDYLTSGGGLIIFLGDAVRAETYNARVLPALVGAGQLSLGAPASSPPKPLHLGEIDTGRPPLDFFASPKSGDLREVAFRRAFPLTVGPQVRVLARSEDDNPAVVECGVGRGRLILVNTSADKTWSDAPERPVWVPFIHRLAFHTARPAPQLIPDGYAGDTVRITVPPHSDGRLTVTPEGGSRQVLEAADGAWTYTYGLPGRYHQGWAVDPTAYQGEFVVNIAPSESDLTVDPERTRAALKGLDATVVPYSDLAAKLESTSLTRADLSLPLLVLAALCLLAEGLLSLGARPPDAAVPLETNP